MKYCPNPILNQINSTDEPIPARGVPGVDVLRAHQLPHFRHVAALARLEQLAQRIGRGDAQGRQQERGSRS